MTDAIWNAELYDGKHSFVWKRTTEVLGLLDPRPGERMLDLGCGTGHLTQHLAGIGVEIIGVDASLEMAAKARYSYPGLRFVVADGRDFDLGSGFDAVFSNAALHWMSDQQRVFERVFAHLRPGGRFVFEMGGVRNLLAIREALAHALGLIGAPADAAGGRMTYLSVNQACALLDSAGFEVSSATWTERETPLEGPDGLRNWVEMFGDAWLQWVPKERREEFFAAVEAHARPRLFREDQWIADYKRLRVRAVRPA